ncbi:MAG: FAD-dependent oxidoreductase [Candidatus Diapherotrites archaeon]|nr:FAD-dependent oxidoreductase [Candidatus Diapherotrites archaeon]
MDYDLAIIGGGPGGLTAAIYAVRRGLSVIVFESNKCGGAMLLTPRIENYPGFEAISGEELGNRMMQQAEKNGAKIEFQNINNITKLDSGFELCTKSGQKILAKAVIVATGGQHRKVGVPGEDEYLGKGFSHCAVGDAPKYKGKVAVVIGGGNSAISSALFLLDICSEVYLAYRKGEFFRAEQAQIDRLMESKVHVVLNAIPVEICGDGGCVKKLRYKDAITEEEKEIDVDAVFAEIGTTPSSALVSGLGVEIKQTGHIKTNERCETNVPGILSAGDVNGGLPQIATAVGDGAIAATAAYEFIKGAPAGADYKH